MQVQIKSLEQKDRENAYAILEKEWGASYIAAHGKIYYAEKMDGFVAIQNKKVVGVVFYNLSKHECEIVALISEIENNGIGTALIKSVQDLAIENKCKRLFLTTTNDNIRALAFYQKRGFTISNIYVDAVKESRKLKPQIPLIADNGIPIRDEIEFEIKL